MEEKNKEFEEFVTRKCIDIIDADKNIPREQIEIIMHIYELGFIDALKILEAKKVIEIHSYF